MFITARELMHIGISVYVYLKSSLPQSLCFHLCPQ